MGTSTSFSQQPETSPAMAGHRRLTELRLPPMFFVSLEYRDSPPKLTASDLPEPEKFHERLAAWLMKQY